MRKYNKGANKRFTIYETVEVEAEVDFSLKDVVEALDDDEIAKEELISLLRGKDYVSYDDSDMNQALDHLKTQSFRFDSEDYELIRRLAEKYNYLNSIL